MAKGKKIARVPLHSVILCYFVGNIYEKLSEKIQMLAVVNDFRNIQFKFLTQKYNGQLLMFFVVCFWIWCIRRPKTCLNLWISRWSMWQPKKKDMYIASPHTYTHTRTCSHQARAILKNIIKRKCNGDFSIWRAAREPNVLLLTVWWTVMGRARIENYR